MKVYMVVGYRNDFDGNNPKLCGVFTDPDLAWGVASRREEQENKTYTGNEDFSSLYCEVKELILDQEIDISFYLGSESCQAPDGSSQDDDQPESEPTLTDNGSGELTPAQLAALPRLDPYDREILRFWFVDKLTVANIAEVYSLLPEDAEARLQWALSALKDLSATS